MAPNLIFPWWAEITHGPSRGGAREDVPLPDTMPGGLKGCGCEGVHSSPASKRVPRQQEVNQGSATLCPWVPRPQTPPPSHQAGLQSPLWGSLYPCGTHHPPLLSVCQQPPQPCPLSPGVSAQPWAPVGVNTLQPTARPQPSHSSRLVPTVSGPVWRSAGGSPPVLAFTLLAGAAPLPSPPSP